MNSVENLKEYTFTEKRALSFLNACHIDDATPFEKAYNRIDRYFEKIHPESKYTFNNVFLEMKIDIIKMWHKLYGNTK